MAHRGLLVKRSLPLPLVGQGLPILRLGYARGLRVLPRCHRVVRVDCRLRLQLLLEREAGIENSIRTDLAIHNGWLAGCRHANYKINTKNIICQPCDKKKHSYYE